MGGGVKNLVGRSGGLNQGTLEGVPIGSVDSHWKKTGLGGRGNKNEVNGHFQGKGKGGGFGA